MIWIRQYCGWRVKKKRLLAFYYLCVCVSTCLFLQPLNFADSQLSFIDVRLRNNVFSRPTDRVVVERCRIFIISFPLSIVYETFLIFWINLIFILFFYLLQPEPDEIKQIAAEGILTCLQDAIEFLEQKQVFLQKLTLSFWTSAKLFSCILRSLPPPPTRVKIDRE